MATTELSKIEQRDGIWIVLVLSAATGRWIVQGEHLTKQAAELNRRNWL